MRVGKTAVLSFLGGSAGNGVGITYCIRRLLGDGEIKRAGGAEACGMAICPAELGSFKLLNDLIDNGGIGIDGGKAVIADGNDLNLVGSYLIKVRLILVRAARLVSVGGLKLTVNVNYVARSSENRVPYVLAVAAVYDGRCKLINGNCG